MHVDPLSPQADTSRHGQDADLARKGRPRATPPGEAEPGPDPVDEVLLSEAARARSAAPGGPAHPLPRAAAGSTTIETRHTDGTYTVVPRGRVRPPPSGGEA